jgi:hypothetical protein
MLFYQLLATTIALAISVYLLGTFAIRLFSIKLSGEELFLRLFLKMLTGCSLLTVSYALFKTGSETVLLPVPILLYLAFRQAGLGSLSVAINSVTSRLQFYRAELGLLLLAGLPLFLLRWILYYDANSPFLTLPLRDYIYYARLASVHNKLGIETTFLENIYQKSFYEQPYHYFDLWLNALIVHITGLPTVWTLCIIVYSLLMLIACLGMGAIIRFFGISYGWALITAALTLTITGVAFPFFTQWSVIANGQLMMGLNFVLYPKTVPIYLFFGVGVLFLLRKRYTSAFYSFSCTPLVYITVLPSTALGLLFLSIALYVFRQTSLKSSLLLLLPMALTGGYILGFYALHPNPSSAPVTAELFKTFLPLGMSVVTLINIFIGTLLNYIIFYFLYFLILAIIVIRWPILVKEHGFVFIWLIGILITAAFFRACTTRNLDSWQFVSTLIIPLSSISLAVFFGFGLSKLNLLGKISLVGSLILITVPNNYSFSKSKPAIPGTGEEKFSPEFIASVQANLPPYGLGGYMFSSSDYLSPYMMNVDSHIGGTYLYGLSNNYSLVSLSVLDASHLIKKQFLRDSSQVSSIIAKSTLYQFKEILQKQNKHYSSDSLKYMFAQQYHLAFICVSKNAQLPILFQHLVTKKIVDSYSGEKIYILDKTKY